MPSKILAGKSRRADKRQCGPVGLFGAGTTWPGMSSVATAREAPFANLSGASCGGTLPVRPGCDGYPCCHRLPRYPHQVIDTVRHEGSVVLIPREGGYLVRIYVELDRLSKRTGFQPSPARGRQSGRRKAGGGTTSLDLTGPPTPCVARHSASSASSSRTATSTASGPRCSVRP
jgi:hypothetical protein